MTKALRAFVLAVAAFAAAGCATFGAPNGGTQSALKGLLQPSSFSLGQNATREHDQVVRFYRSRDFRPLWTGNAENEEMALEARSIMERASSHGLLGEDYLVALMPAAPGAGLAAAQFEIALSEAVLRYANDVRLGRIAPNDIYRDAQLPRPNFDAAAGLSDAVESRAIGKFLESLPPSNPEYRRLREALAAYRALEDGAPRAANTVDYGKDSPERERLIAQLSIEDPGLAAQTNLDPRDVRDAVRRFQARNHLAPDGIAGPKTYAALQQQRAARIDIIKANLERWRWLPRQFEERYISVNVPDQSLEFIRNGDSVFSSRVIVGHVSSPTPILRTHIASLKANPPWNIPGDIAARDLLPHMRRDANYLAERNMVLMDTLDTDPYGRAIDWSAVKASEFFYHVRQLPGPETGLGALMLDMPNDFDVYLHDTPAKNLFAREDRAVSNGCIRVEGILPLASLVLSNDTKAGLQQIDSAIETGETQMLDLENPFPVYLLYWTAAVSEDGSLFFPPDRYGRDQVLIDALNAQRSVASPKQIALETRPNHAAFAR